jgi:hypothetical protein
LEVIFHFQWMLSIDGRLVNWIMKGGVESREPEVTVMARPNALSFDPNAPPVILVSLRVARVERYSRQLFQIQGHVGDYEVAIYRPATDLPTSPTALTAMQVTRLERFVREKMVQVWGYVGDYEVSVCLPTSDGRVKALVHQHKLGEQIGVPRS